jgi:hypothetical protein
MDQKKLVLLFLVVLAILVALALGAGAYRSHQEGGRTPRDYKDPDAGVKLIDGATGWMRATFKLRRMSGCGAPASVITFQGTCEMVIGPGSRRPSRFKLSPEGGAISLCFALTLDKLLQCVAGAGDPKLRQLEEPSQFTVASDSAFLFLSCNPGAGGACRLGVAPS